jgi:soluble lytic murein transglycosylase
MSLKHLPFFTGGSRIALTLVLLLPLLAPASQRDPATPANDEQRSIFIAAEAALKAGRMSRYRQLKQQLKDYPLYPYLKHSELQGSLRLQSGAAVQRFLAEFADTPLSEQLRNRWLRLLAKHNRWQQYLDYSTPSNGNITLRCHRLRALIETGQSAQAFQKVEDIWLHGRSRPKACDPVFKAWQEAGLLDEDLVWQRIELAMNAGQIRLTRYLRRFLSEDERPWVEFWIEIHHKPQRLINHPYLKKTHPYRNAILAHGIRRLARHNPKRAFMLWQAELRHPGYSDKQKLNVIRSLATHLAKQPGDGLETLFETIKPSLKLDPTLSDKQFRIALERHNWERVIGTIRQLPQPEQQQQRWRYWMARALIEIGQKKKGVKLLKDLAKNRSYYGFLASDRLGNPLNMEHESLQVDQAELARLSHLPGMQRARELKILGRHLEARREWNFALRGASHSQLLVAAELARQWEWPSQAIFTLAKIHHWNDLELRFPLAYRSLINQQAEALNLETAWIFAILRQESAFVPDARSSAGALGLMQLMPFTAKTVARRQGQRLMNKHELYQPETNIRLGARYLDSVFRKMRGNPILATAAYNAGPHRVAQWLPSQEQPADVWIETVPFSETREYLKRVMAYTMIYFHRLGDTPEQLPEIWSRPISAKISDQES